MLFGQPARKRRGLARGAAARHFELLFQALVLAAQPIAFDLRAPHVLAEPLILLLQLVDDLLRVTRRRILRAPRHATVMPDSRAEYKWKPPRLCASVVVGTCVARASVG